jgi:single-strand DNA-binding protein
MARTVNSAVVLGNVGADPVVRETAKGTKVASFSVATTDGWGDNEKTNWHRVTAWGKLAEIVEQYVTKGDKIYVSGRIDYGSYEKDGVTVYTVEIIAEDVTLLGGGAPAATVDDSPFG